MHSLAYINIVFNCASSMLFIIFNMMVLHHSKLNIIQILLRSITFI